MAGDQASRRVRRRWQSRGPAPRAWTTTTTRAARVRVGCGSVPRTGCPPDPSAPRAESGRVPLRLRGRHHPRPRWPCKGRRERTAAEARRGTQGWRTLEVAPGLVCRRPRLSDENQTASLHSCSVLRGSLSQDLGAGHAWGPGDQGS